MRAAVNGRARSTWSTTPPRQRALHVAAAAAQGVEREWQPSRRQLVAGAPAAVAALLVVQPVRAAEEQQQQAGAGLYTVYTDAQDKFSINIPASWASGTANLGEAAGAPLKPQATRFSNGAGLPRVVAWSPPDTPDVSVAVTISPSSVEFTSLGSLGRAEDVGQSLVAKMDQGYLLRSNRRAGSPPVQLAKLLSAKEAQGRYYIDYTVQKEGEEARTVCSAVALGYNGLQPRFFTVSASCKESQLDAYGPALRTVVESFSQPALKYY